MANVFKPKGKSKYVILHAGISQGKNSALNSTTRAVSTWKGMTGLDRSWFYTLTELTGFHRSELAALKPEDFELSASLPFARVGGESTKNGKPVQQPIPSGRVSELRPWIDPKKLRGPLFELPEKTVQMLRDELRCWGIKPVDERGRVVDVHSLRHGFITKLAREGVPIRVVQTLAERLRHGGRHRRDGCADRFDDGQCGE